MDFANGFREKKRRCDVIISLRKSGKHHDNDKVTRGHDEVISKSDDQKTKQKS